MMRFYRRAFQDIIENRFVNTLTVVTIALSVLIVSAFALFFINTAELINPWKQGARIMVYLKDQVPEKRIEPLLRQISGMYGVDHAAFISRQEGLERLRESMKRQPSLLENLKTNPLPDAFEIRMIPEVQSEAAMEVLANGLESLPEIAEVEYGQQWIGRVSSIVGLFRLGGYALGALFFAASVFIVANTVRLVLYSRRQEVEIMRLVGATDGFIKAPFYIEGLILGAAGGALGLGVLLAAFLFVSASLDQNLAGTLLKLRFLPLSTVALVLVGSMLVGWLGCYLSLRQFLSQTPLSEPL